MTATGDTRAALTDTRRRVFVSYGHDQYAILAERLADDLRATGYEVWFDRDRIRPGDDYHEYISEGLEWTSSKPGTGCFLLLMTPHSVRRPDGFCLKELARAAQRNLKTIPIMVATVEPPLWIADRDYLDLRDTVPGDQYAARYAEKLRRLSEAIDRDAPQFDGLQARLRHRLSPIAFHTDVGVHLPCFTGRRFLLDAYEKWLADERGEKVFWLTGAPGVGKTALSAHLVATRPEICAHHFCRYGDSERVDARRAVQSIAFQLASCLPDYAQRLNALDLDRLAVADPRGAFNALVEAPLGSDFPAPATRVIMLVDALDEATRNGTNEIAELIATEANRLPPWLRFFVTSRDGKETQFLLQGFSAHPLKASTDENRVDLRHYISDRLAAHVSEGGVLDRVVDALLKRSELLFLYARWVCDEIDAGRLPAERPDAFPRGLSGIYAQFFARQFANIEMYREHVRPVIDVLAAAQEPLTPFQLRRLLKWSEYRTDECLAMIEPLFSAATGRIRPFHQSVFDWLKDSARAMQYRADVVAGNDLLAKHAWGEYRASVGTMSPYSLVHLPAHLAADPRYEDQLRTVLLDFEWIRAKLAAAGIAALRRDYMLRREDRAVHLVGDTLRRGALALQRNSTLLAQQLLGRLRASVAPALKPLLTEAAASGGHIWLRPLTASLIPAGDPLYASLSGHKGTVRSVAISRDGRRAASAGNSTPDQTLRLWDLEVGTELACHPGYAQAGGYTALCITPNSMYALSSLAAEVIVWDLGTGDRVHVLRGHESQVTALATAADRALSGSADGEVIMWDLRELKAIAHWRQQHEAVWSVAISRDGCRGAAATSDRVIVWDLDTGRSAQRVQKTGFDGLWASPPLEFDAEAKRLHFGDPLIEWSLGTDRLRHLTNAPTSGILAIDEAATLALRFVKDDGMSVWSLQSGSRIRRLPGIKAVAAVDITPDARWAIDTAFTHEVRLWDLELLKTVRPANESRNPIYKLDITPDGAHVVLTHDVSVYPRPAKGRSSVMLPRNKSVWDLRTGGRLPEAAANSVLRRRGAVKRAAVAGPPIRHKGDDQYSEFTLEFGDNKVAKYKDEGWTVSVEDRATGERFSTFDCDAPLVDCAAVGSTLVIAEVSGRVHFLKLEGACAKEHSSSVGVRRPRSRISR